MTAPPLLRLTIVGGRRRADVVVPAGLPVAELLPEVGRTLGLLPASTPGVWRLSPVAGDPLDPERSLGAQGVDDGAVLVLAPEPLAVPRHDDPVELWGERWAHLRGASPVQGPAAPGLRAGGAAVLVVSGAVMVGHERAGPLGAAAGLLAAGLLLLGLPGLRLLGIAPAIAGVTGGTFLLGADRFDPVPIATVAVGALAALSCALPCGAFGVLTVPEDPADPADPAAPAEEVRRVDTELRLAARLVLAAAATIGTLLVVLAPVVVGTAAGVGLVLTIALVLACRATPSGFGFGARAPWLLTAAGLLTVVAAQRAGSRPVLGVALVLVGAALALDLVAAGRLRGGAVRLPWRSLRDALGVAGLVALAPLVVLASGVLERLR